MHKFALFLITLLISGNAFADRYPSTSNNDSLKTAPVSWWLLDPEINQVPGISTGRAYEFLKGRPSQTVVVAATT